MRLKAGVVFNCPEGRENNTRAKVKCLMPDFAKGALRLDRDLRGCQYWNEEDLVIVKKGS